MRPTKIEYLSHTWNPIAMRCTPVSEGCKRCWHIAMAKRLAGVSLKEYNPDKFLRKQAYSGGPPWLDPNEIEAPLHVRKPARIGVQFMGDLFHGKISPDIIREVYHMIVNNPIHQFFLLTKRPDQVRRFYNWVGKNWQPWPIPNLWLGVSVEDEQTYEERASILSRIESAHRWISFEPLLGQICLELLDWRCDWIVIGGLSIRGKDYPPKPEWIKYILEQCDSARKPVFIKDNAHYPIKRRHLP